MTVVAKGKQVSDSLRDNLDGSYTQTIIMPEKSLQEKIIRDRKMDELEDFQEDARVTVKVGKASVVVPLIELEDVTPSAVPDNLESYDEAPILEKKDDKPIDPCESRSGGALQLPPRSDQKCKEGILK